MRRGWTGHGDRRYGSVAEQRETSAGAGTQTGFTACVGQGYMRSAARWPVRGVITVGHVGERAMGWGSGGTGKPGTNKE